VLAPLQIVASLPAFTTGNWFTVTVVTKLVAEHPFASVIVTLYDVVAYGVTVIAAVVAPVLHTYDNGVEPIVELAVSVVLVPAQTTFVPVMIGVSAGLTVTVATADVVKHPVAFVTVTV
jgi:hypothetical protein